jgi:hypothetical protein
MTTRTLNKQIHINCNAAITTTQQVGDLPWYVRIWLNPDDVANMFPCSESMSTAIGSQRCRNFTCVQMVSTQITVQYIDLNNHRKAGIFEMRKRDTKGALSLRCNRVYAEDECMIYRNESGIATMII